MPPLTPPSPTEHEDRARRVLLQYMEERGKTKTWLTDRTGISYRTLLRKLNGESRLGFDEVEIIRVCLDIDPIEFHERMGSAA